MSQPVEVLWLDVRERWLELGWPLPQVDVNGRFTVAAEHLEELTREVEG